jgi:hypothetical protein
MVFHLIAVGLQLPIDCGQSLQVLEYLLCDLVEEVMGVKIYAVVGCEKGVEAFGELFEDITAPELLQIKCYMLQQFTLTLTLAVNTPQLL